MSKEDFDLPVSREAFPTNHWGWGRPLSEQARQQISASLLARSSSPLQTEVVLPYVIRGASPSIVTIYTGVSTSEVNRARSWLKAHGQISGDTAGARAMMAYDYHRVKKEIPKDLAVMLVLSKQLVEKGVITSDIALWRLMLEEYKEQKVSDLPRGFPEKLILEGFLTAKVKMRTKLEVALRGQLEKSGLIDRFDGEFDFLTQIAGRIKDEAS